MDFAKKLTALAFVLAVATTAAQATQAVDHSGHHGQANATPGAAASKAEGEVRKVDKEAGKLTLRHGPIPNLEMSDMTMVFRVTDPRLLDGLEARQKVRFTAARIEGQLTVTSLEVIQ